MLETKPNISPVFEETISRIQETYHDNHTDNDKAFADICTNSSLETALGVASLLTNQPQCPNKMKSYHVVILAVELHDAKVEFRDARGSHAPSSGEPLVDQVYALPKGC